MNRRLLFSICMVFVMLQCCILSAAEDEEGLINYKVPYYMPGISTGWESSNKTKNSILLELYWKPNAPAMPHDNCPFHQDKDAPIGRVDDYYGQKVYLTDNIDKFTTKFCIKADIENDTPCDLQYFSLDTYNLKNYYVSDHDFVCKFLSKINPDLISWLSPFGAELLDNADKIKQIIPPIIIPPYSKCTIHWPVKMTGRALILAEICREHPGCDYKIGDEVEILARDYFQRHFDPDKHIVHIYQLATDFHDSIWSDKKYQKYGILIKGIYYISTAVLNGTPYYSSPVTPITGPVMFELTASEIVPWGNSVNIVTKNIGGTGSIIRGNFWTPVSPPIPEIDKMDFTFKDTEPDLGKATLELPKGWEWSVTGYGGELYTTGELLGPFGSPADQPIIIQSVRK